MTVITVRCASVGEKGQRCVGRGIIICGVFSYLFARIATGSFKRLNCWNKIAVTVLFVSMRAKRRLVRTRAFEFISKYIFFIDEAFLYISCTTSQVKAGLPCEVFGGRNNYRG